MRFILSNELPNGYTKLDYLESTGTQYIDTGYIPNQDTRVVEEHYYTKVPGVKGFVYGAGESATLNAFELYTWNLPWNSPYNKSNMAINPSSESLYTLGKITTDKNKNNIQITYADGTTQSNYTNYATFTAPYTMYLFAIHRPGTTLYNSDCLRLCKCTIWDNDVLVRDYIPVLRKSDNKPGLFDLVEGVFYTNAGTDEFLYTKPEDVLVNPKYIQVEYLEAKTRQQYINTGIYPNLSNVKIEIKAIKETNYSLFGSAETNKYFNFTGSSGNNFLRYGGGSTTSFAGDNNVHTYVVDRGSIYVDGELKSSRDTVEGISSYPIALFARLATVYSDGGNHRIYYCKIWNEGKLVREYIPAIRKSDNKPGLFDRVTGTFFVNTGSGEFATGDKILPVPGTYEELEYIESTGTQWIDTGYTLGNESDIELVFTIINDYDSNSNYSIFGSRNSADSSNIGVANSYPQFPLYLDFCDTNYSSHRATKTGTNLLNIKYKAVLNKSKRELSLADTGEVLVTNSTSSAGFTTPGSAYLFNQRNGFSSNKFIGKIYYCKIWDNNELVRDFVPAKRKSDDVIGLYDKVTQTFYTNQGTGTFIGASKTPVEKIPTRLIKASSPVRIDGYIKLEYLENPGKQQYIDTGFIANSGSRIETTITPLETNSDKWAIGSYETDCRRYVAYQYPADRWGGGYGTYYSGSTTMEQNKAVSFVCEFGEKQIITIDGTTVVNISNSNPSNVATRSLYLFGRHGGSASDTNSFLCRIGETKLYQDNVLVKDFVPVLDNSYVPCMYEAVSKTLYYSQGTGSFKAGDICEELVTRFIPSDYITSDYTPVKYIEATGTQYINTGVKVGANTKLDLAYQLTDLTPTNNGIFGASSGETLQFLAQSSQTKYSFQWTPNTIQYFGTKSTDKTRVIFDVPNKLLTNGEDTLSFETYTLFYPNGNIMLMANGHVSAYGLMKIFECKIYEGNELIRRFIPVIRKTDSKPGLWDIITQTFYTNAGTGDFTYEE